MFECIFLLVSIVSLIFVIAELQRSRAMQQEDDIVEKYTALVSKQERRSRDE